VYYTVLTKTGQAKLANATVLGKNVEISTIAVGDGGGSAVQPDESQTALVRQVWSGPVNRLYVDEKNSNWIVTESYIPADTGGFTIREVGLFDADGDLITVGSYPETYKPSIDSGTAKDLYLKIIIEVSNAETVELKIDPTVVIASRAWVEEHTAAELAAHDASDFAHPALARRTLEDVEGADFRAAARRALVRPGLEDGGGIADGGRHLWTLRRSSGNVIQGAWMDPDTGDLYASWVESDIVHVARYADPGTFGYIAPAWEVDTGLYGHQQLAGIRDESGRLWLVTSGSAGALLMMRLDETGVLESREIQIYGADGGHVTSAISPGGRYIAVEGYLDSRQNIRIYDAAQLLFGSGAEPVAQWDITALDPGTYPLQGIALDESRIYLAYGNGDEADPNFIRIYTLDGALLDEKRLTIGNEIENDKYEQEGLLWVHLGGRPVLAGIIATGADGANTIRIYTLTGRDAAYRRSRRIDIINPDDATFLAATPTACGQDATLERLYVRASRDGEVCDLDIWAQLGGFDVDLPSDATTRIDFDLAAIGAVTGAYEAVTGGKPGVATLEYSGDVDAAINAATVTIAPPTLTVWSGEIIALDGSGFDTMIVRVKATVKVR